MIDRLGGNHPDVDGAAFIAWNAEVIGRVSLGAETSVWYSASIRGDIDAIAIGDGSNVQDNAALHVDEGAPLTVGRNVTIGHGAIVHGCTVGDDVLIGMGAILLNRSRIADECIVGAGALVTEGKEFPRRSLIVGSPAKAVREISDDELAKVRANAAHYRERARDHRAAGTDSRDRRTI